MAGKKDKPKDELTDLSRVYEVLPDPERSDYHMVKPTTYFDLVQGQTDVYYNVFSGPNAEARATRYCDHINSEVDADRLVAGHIPPVVILNGARVKTLTISPDDGKAQVVITLNRDQAKIVKGLLDVTAHGSFRFIAEPIAFQQRMEDATDGAAGPERGEDWQGDPGDHRRVEEPDTPPDNPGDADGNEGLDVPF